jgi:hypothetical protein
MMAGQRMPLDPAVNKRNAKLRDARSRRGAGEGHSLRCCAARFHGSAAEVGEYLRAERAASAGQRIDGASLRQ